MRRCTGHRRGLVFRGNPAQTRSQAQAHLASIPPSHVAWSHEDLRALLGQTRDAVVLDLHSGLDANALGQAQGLIRGGGDLILLMPPAGELSLTGQDNLAISPYTTSDVGSRLWRRLEHATKAAGWETPCPPLTSPYPEPAGSPEQAETVSRLIESWKQEPQIQVLLAHRGRGKSTALGLALRAGSPRLRVALTGPSETACQEVLRALGSRRELEWSSPLELAQSPDELDLLVIDEAAQLSVPLLRRLVQRHPRAHLALATTEDGYEGTGRGFVLRFLDWARNQERPVKTTRLREPIRWSSGCPVEALIVQVLAMDARPAAIEVLDSPTRALRLTASDLAQNESRLQGFWGLLCHAHYRTTSSDLHRILDAPNLTAHALLSGDHVVAATLTAEEGGLAEDTCDALARGEYRIRGHALPDTLISHLGQTQMGILPMIRSVRIATHPALRRKGLARQLVDHVHAHHNPELFGTVFGATPELLRFRRAMGYQLVRLASGRGERTGEPAVVMLRPQSARARHDVAQLRARLARDLSLHLHWLTIDTGIPLEPALISELKAGLPNPLAWTPESEQLLVMSYLKGPCHFESASGAVLRAMNDRVDSLSSLSLSARNLVQARLLERQSWEQTRVRAGLGSIRATQRALRRILRDLWGIDD